MDDSTSISGGCLCGAVSVKVNPITNTIGACHCSTCRQWGGGPFMSIHCDKNVTFYNSDGICVYASSDWAERGFCRACGTHLFYRLLQNGEYFMPAGIFMDAVDNLTFDHQVFVDQKPAYYEFANATQNKTGEEIFAEFGTD